MVNVNDEEVTEDMTKDLSIHIVNDDLEVFSLGNNHSRFMGACLDIGDFASIIGLSQAESYCKMIIISLFIENGSQRLFRLRNKKRTKISNIKVLYPIH